MRPDYDWTAAILAGGLGTRLRSVVADRPKVLAPVAGRPFLAYLLDQLEATGIQETVLLVGFGAEQVRSAFGKKHGRMKLVYSVEPEPLGTAGAVRHALSLLAGDTVLLLNGDSYCGVDLEAFRRFHEAHGHAASLCLAQVENASRFGRVQLHSDDRVIRFEEKDPKIVPGWINAGLYLFERRALEAIAPARPVSMEREFLPELVAKGEVYGFRSAGRFIDIGIPDTYLMAGDFFAQVT
jgi:NDP-sugar pyrophosphorylase family protein